MVLPGKNYGEGGGVLGCLPLAGSLCIAIGYAVIVTYVLKALIDSLLGTLMDADAASWFESFSAKDFSVVPYHFIVVIGTLLTLYLGARSIERTNKVMMPLFFLIFLVLAVRVAFLPGVADAYRFMFMPRWEALTDPMIWIWAMGQAFFSLSLTGSGMIVYGAYLSKEEDVVGIARHTALFDTIAALVAALVIIPACFSYRLDVGAGPGLQNPCSTSSQDSNAQPRLESCVCSAWGSAFSWRPFPNGVPGWIWYPSTSPSARPAVVPDGPVCVRTFCHHPLLCSVVFEGCVLIGKLMNS